MFSSAAAPRALSFALAVVLFSVRMQGSNPWTRPGANALRKQLGWPTFLYYGAKFHRRLRAYPLKARLLPAFVSCAVSRGLLAYVH